MATASGTSNAALDSAAIRSLRDHFNGWIIAPGDGDYERHRRVWNGNIDRHPAVILRCRAADDVIAALQFARETGLELAVRGGGHSFAGHSTCDHGIVIDLSPMNAIEVNAEHRSANVQAGALLGEIDAATTEHSLVLPAGIVTHTGIAGLTLGGGIGWLQRKHGLTIDQLDSVDVVTADGQRVSADERTNSDLFWGIRGGGGNFGIITEFRFRLQPLQPVILAGPIIWDQRDAPAVMRHYRDWIQAAPDELTTIVFCRRAPQHLPLAGQPVVMIGCCYAGAPEAGERVIEPLRRFGKPLLDLCQPKPFTTHQAMLDPTFAHGRHYYFRPHDTGPLSDTLIDTLAEHATRIRSPHSGFGIFQMGGAIARHADDDTAFTGRQAHHTVNINGIAETAGELEPERDWVLALSNALAPYETGVYINFLMDEPQHRIKDAYGTAKYERLQALKRKYDPDNLFQRNHNIPPE
jgi:UDP-N-acetylenolpyruvoylglucosamine reductase